jgi:hypothetical protein
MIVASLAAEAQERFEKPLVKVPIAFGDLCAPSAHDEGPWRPFPIILPPE